MKTSSLLRSFIVCAAVLSCLLLAFSSSAVSAAETQYPLGIAVDDQGVIYLADRELPGVWQIKDQQLSVYYQGSKKFRTPLNAVRCLAIDGQGKLLAGDSATRDIYRFDEPGKPTPLTKGGIGIPMCMATNSKGEIFVGDLELQKIWKVAASGGTPERVADIPAVRGIAVDSQDQVWAVSAVGMGKLWRVSADGKAETIVPDCKFGMAHQMVLDEKGTAYVADGYGKAIWRIAEGKSPEKWVEGDPFVNPVGLARRGDLIYVADPRANAVLQINAEGKVSKLEVKPAP